MHAGLMACELSLLHVHATCHKLSLTARRFYQPNACIIPTQVEHPCLVH